jgi:outer membrane protein insertion porin family
MSFSRFESEDRRTVLLADSSFADQVFSRQVSSLRLNYSFDKRDSRLQPTVGTRYSGSLEYTGGPLGGTTNFIRGRGVFSHFLPLTKKGLRTVAAINAEIGAIKPFDGDQLFFNDRFYLGGENTIRGHRFRSIWVRDREGNTVLDVFGTPLGGDKFLQFNAELHFLVGGPFRVLLFGDAANVFSESQPYSFDGMRYTAGLEMQVNVPVFGAPLRFIWSENLNQRDDDRPESFQFSVGTSF